MGGRIQTEPFPDEGIRQLSIAVDVELGDGTGEFSEIVDIQGELREGENRIEVTSESLGHVQAFLQGEAVRRIHGRTS